jgi:hypothetical protein
VTGTKRIMSTDLIDALLLTLPAISAGTMVLIRTAHGTRTTVLAGLAAAWQGPRQSRLG